MRSIILYAIFNMKNEISVVHNTIGYLKHTKIPRNYRLNITSYGDAFHVNLRNKNKIAANMEVYVMRNNNNRIAAEYEGATHPNYRGRGLGTLIRAVLTKALLESGVNYIQHPFGMNINNIVAKSIATKKGISINEARKTKNFIPLSTQIVRKLGYKPDGTGNKATPNMNFTKINKIIRNVPAAINIQRAYRRHLARLR